MINREKELHFLKERAAGKRAELVVMWGRRRLGKTTLLKALCEAHRAIYFLATRAPAHEQLQRLSIAFAEFFQDPLLERATLPSWEDAFSYLARNAKSRTILAVDEFPYLVEADPSIPSRFQFGWDEHLARNPNVMLLLNGSSLAMMEQHVLGSKSPLYGRRTGQWRIELCPLSLRLSSQRPAVHLPLASLSGEKGQTKGRTLLTARSCRTILQQNQGAHEELVTTTREVINQRGIKMQRRSLVSVVGSVMGVILVIAMTAPQVRAAGTETFNNTVDSFWDTAGNWSGTGSQPPAAGDTVIINGNVTNFWTSTANLASYTLNNGFTHTFVGTNVFLKATTVTIHGTLTHGTNTATAAVGSTWYPDSLLAIQATDVTIGSDGKIDVTGRGYEGRGTSGQYAYGPGGGRGGSNHGGGGAYGGTGAARGGDNAQGPYGSVSAPLDPGSGGGGCNGAGERGGAGGGAVLIQASGSVQVDGTITANGEVISPRNPYGAGGGSGGSIYITCATLKGSGTIRADGSDGYNRGISSGGGGGGRISVIYSLAESVGIKFSANCGASYDDGGCHGDWAGLAQVGTLYLSDTNFLPTTLVGNFFNLQIPGLTSWMPSALTVTGACVRLQSNLNVTVAGNLVVGTNGTLIFGEHSTVEVTGNLIVTNGGKLYLYSGITNGTWTDCGSIMTVDGAARVYPTSGIYPVSHPTSVGTPKFIVGSVNVAAGAVIYARGLGYLSRGGGGLPGYGPGGGASGGNEGAGGGHGGMGGIGRTANSVLGGGTYGSISAPITAGSGAGEAVGTQWAMGGGAVRIKALGGTVTVDGTIVANGLSKTNWSDGEHGLMYSYGGGGGAGGSVYIECSKFGGSGLISAAGGDGGSTGGWCGGGGGGRVAVWRQVDSWAGSAFTTNIMVAGGTNGPGDTSTAGTNGTIFLGNIPIISGTTIILQ